MTAIHETAYPRLKPHPTPDELEKNFMPSFDEKILMEESTHAIPKINKLGFMLTLKCYQCLGYAVNIKDIPDIVVTYIAQAIELQEIPDLGTYTPSSKKRHRKIILQYLKISDDEHKQRHFMKQSALKSATFKEGLADIINDMIETLIKERFELPGFSTLERMARAARVLTNTRLYQRITTKLNDDSKRFLDTLFDSSVAPDNTTTTWALLKQEMKAPTTQNVKEYIDCLARLKKWRLQAPANIDDIPIHRLEQFIQEGIALDSADMKDLKQDKRYTLAVTMLSLTKFFDALTPVFYHIN